MKYIYRVNIVTQPEDHLQQAHESHEEISAVKSADESAGESAGHEPQAVKDAVGRNDLCPCGSGKKYKKCCGK